MNSTKNSKFILFLLITAIFVLPGFLVAQPVKAQATPLLIKTADSPAVYFVSQRLNGKKIILNEAVFKSYGDKWSWVKTVALEKLNNYPDIKLVKTENNPGVYYLNGNIKRLIPSAKVFTELGFDWQQILTINQTDLDSYQTETALNSEVNITNLTIADRQKLLVSLVDERLPAVVVPSGVWYNFLKINFQNSNNQPLIINGLTITLIGMNNGDQEVSDVYLTNNEDEQISNPANLRGRRALFRLNQNPIMVPARGSKIIKVWASAKTPDIYVGFGLEQADFIYTTSQVIGQFPVNGFIYRVIDGSNFGANVKIDSVKISDTLREVRIGAQNQIITKFQFNETSGTQNVLLKKIILTRTGRFPDKNLANIDLVKSDNKILATAKTMKNGQIVFDLNRQPFRLMANKNETFTIRGDFVSGIDETLQLVIDKLGDVVIEGEESGYRLLAQAVLPVGLGDNSAYNSIKIASSEPVINISAQTRTGDIISGAKNAVLGKFVIKANGRDIIFNDFHLEIKSLGSHPLIDNIIIKHDEQILARFRASNFNNQPSQIWFERELRLKDRESFNFEIFGEVDAAANNLDGYKLILTNFDLVTAEHEQIAANWRLETKAVGVKVSEANVVKNDKYLSLAAITGLRKQLIGSFSLQIGSAEDLELNDVTIEEMGDQLNGNNGYPNIYLAINRRIIANIELPLSSPHIFTINPYRLSRGKSYTLDFYADAELEARGDTLQLRLVDLALIGRDSQVRVQVGGLNGLSQATQIFASQIEFQIQPINNQLIAGEKDLALGRFKLINPTPESVQIKELYLYETADSDEFSYQAGFSNLRLVLSNNHRQKIGFNVRQPALGGNKLGNFKLEPFAMITIDVLADTSQRVADKTINLMIQDVNAYGQTSKLIPTIIGDLLILGPVNFNNFE